MKTDSTPSGAKHGKETLPDPASHRTGWSARMIDGVWCVGMTGNLDTVHDAVVRVNRHGSAEEAADIAKWIASTYTEALRAWTPTRPRDRDGPAPADPRAIDEDAVDRAARHVLAQSRRGDAAMGHEQGEADADALLNAYRDIIRKALASGELNTKDDR